MHELNTIYKYKDRWKLPEPEFTQPDLAIPNDWIKRFHTENFADLFPLEAQEVIYAVSAKTGTHPWLVALFYLSTGANVVQCLYYAQRNGFKPMSCAEYALGLDDSTGGKSIAVDYLNEPQLNTHRKHVRQGKRAQKTGDRFVWELRKADLTKRMKAQLNDPVATEKNIKEYAALNQEEPVEARFASNFIMTNTNWTKVAEGLSKASPSAGIINTDAKSMLRELAKSSGEFCDLWSAGDLNHERPTSGTFHQAGACLGITMATQPMYWDKFMDTFGDIFFSGGLGSRMHVLKVPGGFNTKKFLDQDLSSLKRHHTLLENLLARVDIQFDTGNFEREIIVISAEANAQLILSEAVVDALCADGEFFSCVRFRARRFAEHCIRTAAVLHVLIGREGNVVQLDILLHAVAIERWRLLHYREHFGYLGVPQTERDAKKIVAVFLKYLARGLTDVLVSQIKVYMTTADSLKGNDERLENALAFLRSKDVIHRVHNGAAEKYKLTEVYLKKSKWQADQLFSFPTKYSEK